MKIITKLFANTSFRISFCFAVCALLIAAIWFSQGKQLAIGEEGLPFYNPSYTLNAFNFGWYKTGTGHSYSTIMPRVPYWYLISILDSLKFPTFFLEFVTYSVLLLSGLVGMYFCTFFITNDRKIASIAALFYLCNLYTLSQIWSRFIFLGFFAWAYLPLFIFTSIKFLEHSTRKNIFIFVIGSLLFSNTYGQTGYVLTLWSPVIVYTIVAMWKNTTENSLSYLKRILILISVWLLSSIWWLYPALTIGAGGFNEFSSWKSNFESLQGVSQYFPTPQIVQLKQSFLFGKDTHLFNYYNDWFLSVISILIIFITVYGFVKCSHKKLLGLIFIIGWFISKGTNGVIGYYFYKVLFKFIPLTAVLRNPYEKFGLVIVFAYAILFAYGITSLFNNATKLHSRIVLAVLTFTILIILPLPLWTGSVFDARAAVSVPNSYHEANRILEKNNNRLIQLPLVEGDGAAYTWGFIGREPSEFLFSRESISKQLRFDPFDKMYKVLPKYFENNKITNLLGAMNVQHIVYHNDIDLKKTTVHPVPEDKIAQWENISKVKQVDKLSLYEINKENVLPKLFVVSKAVSVMSPEEGIEAVLNNKINLHDSIFTEDKTTLNSTKIPQSKITDNHSLSSVISIKDVSEPFILVYNAMYDPNWEASVKTQVLKNHITVNGYANGWIIDRKGSYEITVRYTLFN